MKKFFMQCVDANTNRRLIGSDNEFIISDLKTLRGVLNRIRKYNINHDKEFEVYEYYGYLLDNNLKLVYRSY